MQNTDSPALINFDTTESIYQKAEYKQFIQFRSRSLRILYDAFSKSIFAA